MEQSHIINLKDIESTYSGPRQEQLYLKSINLTVTSGEILGIIGRAGAGKSALLRCIGLLDRPLTGIVSIDQKNLTFMASPELVVERRNIGLVSSKPEFLQTQNVNKNVALPLKIQRFPRQNITKLVEQALAQVELSSKALSLPGSLSQLQKIQLDLARNLVNRIKILLCDDIFVGLDQKSSEYLITLLRKIQKENNLTIILTTNDSDIIKTICDRVIVMHLGAIVEKCSVFELFTRPASDTAREFIRFTTKHELPTCFRRKIVAQESPEHHALVRINFTECLAPEEILNNTLDAYDLKMNIIQAYQEKINNHGINIMIIEIFGDSLTVNNAVTFLNNNGLQSEIIGYAPNIN
ncbi:MAG TPA: ATP-binding cassette domain-containing protein [Gammaproteobacteria bacterium]|nr:ATP-binding cassette domain-containing protein [Gammaproteobacteria bacterium]